MRNLGFLALAFGSLVFTGGPAAAQGHPAEQDNGFGRASVWAFSSDSALTIQHSSQDVTTIQLAPSVDYFVLDNFSVGGFVSFDYSKSGAVRRWNLQRTPRHPIREHTSTMRAYLLCVL